MGTSLSTSGAVASGTAAVAGGLVLRRVLSDSKAERQTRLREAYDVIVVGAGSGGCVLAARLARGNPDLRVLLLEAGPDADNHLAVKTPALCGTLQKSKLDWSFQTPTGDSSTYAKGMVGGRMNLPRGRMTGGCSSINYMMACRCAPADYDEYAEAMGPEWSYESLVPYFKRSESAKDPALVEAAGSGDVRGTDGPIQIGLPPSPNPLTSAFVKSGEAVGLVYNPDYLSRNVFGVSEVQQTVTKDGLRCSTSRAFLSPDVRPANLTVVTCTHVTRVLFDDAKRAKGVAAVVLDDAATPPTSKFKEDEIFVTAAKEVVLCAGALQSPQLLMLSGVGPASHLTSLGIDVVADVPGVGQNLQDHMAVVVPYEDKKLVGMSKSKALAPSTVLSYVSSGTGPLASSALEGAAHLRTGVTPEHKGPDMQILFFAAGGNADMARTNIGLQPRLVQDPTPPRFHFLSTLLHPRSRGQIKLATADPFDAPVVSYQALTDPHDRDVLLKGVRLIQRMAGSEAFDPYRGNMAVADFNPHPFDSDEYWMYMIQHVANTLYHPTSTCRASNAPADKTAVVDGRLRVRGVSGLRVADASVFPSVPSGNTNLPVVVVAERLSDFMLDELAEAPRARL